MVRAGTEYERFVYGKLRRLFSNARVTLNDRITGKQSGLPREIDVSIIFDIEGSDMLYIVQCKDYATRSADITVLGEFSAVMEDVGAAKGFLVCTSGFARSNRQYARALAIELLTFEDIKSDRWHADIQIPLIFIRKKITWDLTTIFIANAGLADKKKGRAIKYVTPSEYSHAKDHVRDETFPLHFKVSGPSGLDDSFIRIPSDLPVTAPVVGVINKWTEIERAQGKGRAPAGQSSSTTVPAPSFLQQSMDAELELN